MGQFIEDEARVGFLVGKLEHHIIDSKIVEPTKRAIEMLGYDPTGMRYLDIIVQITTEQNKKSDIKAAESHMLALRTYRRLEIKGRLSTDNEYLDVIYNSIIIPEEHHIQASLTDITQANLEATRKNIDIMNNAARAKDADTGLHVDRIGAMAGMLAILCREVGVYKKQITNQFIERIMYEASLHDIGKLNIDDAILKHPGKLYKFQFEKMKTHTLTGYDILEANNIYQMGTIIALTHHEQFSGKGYPLGLKGYDIPLEGRLTMIVDIYDALSSKRPYKGAFTKNEVLKIMHEEKDKFDPLIFKVFIDNLEKFHQYRKRSNEKEEEMKNNNKVRSLEYYSGVVEQYLKTQS